MDQGCIAAMKKLYKTALLRQILAKESTSTGGIKEFLKSWSLYDCCVLVARMWKQLTETTLKNAWNKLLNEYYSEASRTVGSSVTDNWSYAPDVVELLNRFPGDNFHSLEEVDQWLLKDQNAPVFQEYSDQDIIDIIHNPQAEMNKNQDLNGHIVEDDVEEPASQDFEPESFTLEDAYRFVQFLSKWTKSQDDCSPSLCELCEELEQTVVGKILK